MLKLIEPQSADRISCLVISKAGIGKTSLIRTLYGQEWIDGAWTPVKETGQNVCVLSAESGLIAVRDLVNDGTVRGFEIASFEEFGKAYNMLATDPSFKERFNWIFIDSLSEISERCYSSMKAKFPSKSDSFKLWGEYTDAMKKTIKAFRDLSHFSVVFSCLETYDKDENNRRFVSPALAGKELKEKLPSYFDEVLYMSEMRDEKGNSHRVIYTQPADDRPAKDRSGKLNPIEAPNLLTIKRKIMED